MLNITVTQPWMDLPPQSRRQGFAQCYGLVKIKDSYYAVTDLVSDHHAMPSQLACQPGLERKADFDRHLIEQYTDLTNNKTPELSLNMYDQILSMKLGNLSALDSIPDNYVHMLLDYVAQVSRAMAHAH